MNQTLLANTASLVVKLPDHILLPEYQDKIRVRKTIIRTVIQLMQTQTLELVHVGWKSSENRPYFSLETDSESTTVIAINVIESSEKLCDFKTPSDMLLKRFKRELIHNNEHILIDNTHVHNGKSQRLIEIYINSRNAHKRTHVESYTLPAEPQNQYLRSYR